MTQNEFQEWKVHPVTEEFLNHLKKAKQETMELWANRTFTTEGENQFALGGVYSINQILELDYEDIMGV
jgi:hypothetical protein